MSGLTTECCGRKPGRGRVVDHRRYTGSEEFQLKRSGWKPEGRRNCPGRERSTVEGLRSKDGRNTVGTTWVENEIRPEGCGSKTDGVPS